MGKYRSTAGPGRTAGPILRSLAAAAGLYCAVAYAPIADADEPPGGLGGTYRPPDSVAAAGLDGMLRIGALGDGRYAVDLRVVPRGRDGHGCVAFGVAAPLDRAGTAVVLDRGPGGVLFAASSGADPSAQVSVRVLEGGPPVCSLVGLADGSWVRTLDGVVLLAQDVTDLTLMLRDTGHLPPGFADPGLPAQLAGLAAFSDASSLWGGASPAALAIALRAHWRDRVRPGGDPSPGVVPLSE